MKKILIATAALLILTGILFHPKTAATPTEPEAQKATEQPAQTDQVKAVREFLKTKNSPLAEETEFLLEQEHWKLLIAISNIESQFCKRKIAFNCWGIGGDSAYRRYKNLKEAIEDADNLIKKWHDKGKWLTVESMNCSYVVPCSPNWVKVTNQTLKDIEKVLQ